MFRLIAFALVIVGGIFPFSADAQVSRMASDKRSIEIRASGKVTVPAEIATVKIGFQNQAATKDEAYQENTKASAKIIRALLEAKVSRDAIETRSLTLQREDVTNAANVARPAKFSADQEWQVTVRASDAQKIVDIAVGAGANQVGDVDWSVSDPVALEAKAYAVALGRAKSIAEGTASQAGVKLGDILSISNFVSQYAFPGFLNTETAMITVSGESLVKTTPLALFPPRIDKEASVAVVYAIDK